MNSEHQSIINAIGLGSVRVVDMVGTTLPDTQLFVVEHIVLSNGKVLIVDEYRGLCVVENANINAEDAS